MLGARRFWREVDDDEHNKTKQNKGVPGPKTPNPPKSSTTLHCLLCNCPRFPSSTNACVGVRCLWRSRVGSIRTLCGEQVCTLNSAPAAYHASYNSTNWGKTKPNTTKKTNKQTTNNNSTSSALQKEKTNKRRRRKEEKKRQQQQANVNKQQTTHPFSWPSIHPAIHPTPQPL